MSFTLSDADAHRVRMWDGVMLFWIVFWVVVGTWTGYEIWQLTGLAASTVESAHGLQTIGEGLRRMADAPVVGERLNQIGERVVSTASEISTSGESAGRSVRGLAVLIGIAVGVGPIGPVLLSYLPRRRARARDRAAVHAALQQRDARPALLEYLARRAVNRLDFPTLSSVTATPGADLAEGRHDRLARLELDRLGLADPAIG